MAISSRAERLCTCGKQVKYYKTKYGPDLCRSCYSVANYQEHRDARLKKQNDYYQTNPEARDRTRNRSLLQNRELYQKYREAVFDLKGRKCVRCGYDANERALQFDHINGGGAKQQREMRGWRKRLQWMLDNPDEIQILCSNCNQIKRSESSNEKPPGPPRRF
jgi:5-methylcytosine-specific restriction endonuclease McrA